MASTRTTTDIVAQNSRRLIRFFSKNRHRLSPLLILTHDFPDPDALAGAFALRHLAEQFGISSKIVYGGVIGRTENRGMVSLLKIPVHKLRKSDLRKYRRVVLVDTQPGFQNNSFPPKRRATLVIDQHPPSSKPATEMMILDLDCGATCVIPARALLIMKREVPAKVATALAYGILSDTLNFYRSRRPDVVQTYLDLLPFCDMGTLARIQNPWRSKKFFATLGRGIQNALVCRTLIVAHLGLVENPDLISQIADFFLTTRGIQYSLATGRYHGRLHVSLRVSRPTVKAGEILSGIFDNPKGAGGHDVIAGGSLKVGEKEPIEVWNAAEKGLVDRLLKHLRFPRKGEFRFPFRSTEK